MLMSVRSDFFAAAADLTPVTDDPAHPNFYPFLITEREIQALPSLEAYWNWAIKSLSPTDVQIRRAYYDIVLDPEAPLAATLNTMAIDHSFFLGGLVAGRPDAPFSSRAAIVLALADVTTLDDLYAHPLAQAPLIADLLDPNTTRALVAANVLGERDALRADKCTIVDAIGFEYDLLPFDAPTRQ